MSRERFDRWLTLPKLIVIEAALVSLWLWFMHATAGGWPWE